jgi:hypothetical protein
MKLAAATLANEFVRLEPFEARHRDGLIEAAHADMSIFRHMPYPVAREGYGGWFDWLLNEQAAGRWMPFAVIVTPPPFTDAVGEGRSTEPSPPPCGEGVGGGGEDTHLYKLAPSPPTQPSPARGEGRAHRSEALLVECGGAVEKIVGQSCYLAIRPHDAGVEIGGTWYRREAQGTRVNPAAKLLLIAHAFACGAERVEFKTDALNAQSRAALLKLGASFEGIFRRQMRRPDATMRDNAYFSIIREEWDEVRAKIKARLGAHP